MIGGLFVYKLIVIVLLNGVAYRDVVRAEYDNISDCNLAVNRLIKNYIPTKGATVQYECQIHKRWQSVWSII